MTLRRALHSALLVLCGIALACGVGEVLVRIATANQANYVIEMWRYARLLKEESPDPQVGHQNRPGAAARLQGVEVRINALGMRGPMPDPSVPPARTVALLGDSVAFGWGVPEGETLRAQLARALGRRWQVVNAGVGNMNLVQIVAHWSHLRNQVRAGTIIILATPRSSEVQPPDSTNWLVEHSELAALTVTFVSQFASGAVGRDDLIAAYRRAWSHGPGLNAMAEAMDRMKRMQMQRNPRIIVAQVPDTHDIDHYALGFIARSMRRQTLQHGWEFVDLLPALRGVPSRSLWVSAQDVHPNGAAFARMASALAPIVRRQSPASGLCASGGGAGLRTCPRMR